MNIKNNRKALFIIQTPFQLFNAIEAAGRLEENSENTLIFIDRGNARNKEQVENGVKSLKTKLFSKYFEINLITFIDKISYGYKSKEFDFTKESYHSIYTASYRNLTAHIINITDHKELIILDDGNNSISRLEKISNNHYNKKHKAVFQLITKIILRKKINTQFLNNAIFFTMYGDSSKVKNKIIVNDYQYLKKFSNKPKNEDGIIIGSKCIDQKLTPDIFEQYIRQLVNHIKNEGLQPIYIPHRHENIAYLEEIAKKLNFEVRPLETNIELYYLNNPTLPSRCYTIKSAAADAMKSIFGVDICYLKVNNNHISNEMRTNYENIYQHFSNQKYQEIVIK